MIHHGMHSINSLSSFLLGKIQDKPLPLVREKRTTLSIVYLVIGAILLQKDKISAYQFCLFTGKDITNTSLFKTAYLAVAAILRTGNLARTWTGLEQAGLNIKNLIAPLNLLQKWFTHPKRSSKMVCPPPSCATCFPGYQCSLHKKKLLHLLII